MVTKNKSDSDKEPPFVIIKNDKVASAYEIHLSEHIENNFQYVELMHTLRMMNPEDICVMYLANYGGFCNTGFQLINAIKDCMCGVDIVVDAPCYSMGAIIALSGRSLTMNPGTFLMFHNYSGGDFGKGKERLDATMHYYGHFHKQIERVCSPFLDKKELELLKNDQDVYISVDDKSMNRRIKRHFKEGK